MMGAATTIVTIVAIRTTAQVSGGPSVAAKTTSVPKAPATAIQVSTQVANSGPILPSVALTRRKIPVRAFGSLSCMLVTKIVCRSTQSLQTQLSQDAFKGGLTCAVVRAALAIFIWL